MSPSPRYKSALITGATSGIGRAMALELGRRGTFIHALGRRQEKLDELLSELAAGGAAWAVDVADRASLRAAMESAHGAEVPGGGLDLVVANAGIAENGIDAPDAAEAAAEVIGVNAIAAAATLEYGFDLMRNRADLPPRARHLVAISSLAGTRGLPGARAYCASKAALSTYVAAMRFSIHGTGIGLTDIQPGFIKTAMTERNRFKMPFLMELDDAAIRMVNALDREKPPRTMRFPRRLAWPLRLAAAAMPESLWLRALG